MRVGGNMNTAFIRSRITELRMEKGVSEYQMSLDLGMSRGYVQSISSGKASPSLKQLFNICEYFNISLPEFFDEAPEKNKAQNAIWNKLEKLDVDDLMVIENLIDRFLALHDRK